MNKVNVYGSFAQALLFSGIAGIPRLLLDHYHELGITNEEIVLLLHIVNNSNGLTIEELALKMNLTVSRVEQMIEHLKELKYIKIEDSFEQNQDVQTYNIVGLIEELADLWAIKRVKEIEADKVKTDNNPSPNSLHLVSLFEQEIGRPLTVLECEQIERWFTARYSQEIIVEALRRGVSAGIRNFRYIDSILREWEKKGLKTLADIENDDREFQNRQEKKNKQATRKKNQEKYKNIYL